MRIGHCVHVVASPGDKNAFAKICCLKLIVLCLIEGKMSEFVVKKRRIEEPVTPPAQTGAVGLENYLNALANQ